MRYGIQIKTGDIIVTLRQIDDYCELNIKDTGIGIDTEHLENLGESFLPS